MTDPGTFDRFVRVEIARAIRDRGVIPRIDEVVTTVGSERAEVEASFRRMIEGRVFIPRQDSLEILAYNPFCVEATGFGVTAAGRSWSAICAWDALGIPPALEVTGTVEAPCGDCAAPIRIEVGRGGRAVATDETVMQVATPARDFWKNIYLT